MQFSKKSIFILILGVSGHGGGDLPAPRPSRGVPHGLPPVATRPQNLQVGESKDSTSSYFCLDCTCYADLWPPSPLGRSCCPMWKRGWARTWRTAARTPSTPQSNRLRVTWSVKTRWWWHCVSFRWKQTCDKNLDYLPQTRFIFHRK